MPDASDASCVRTRHPGVRCERPSRPTVAAAASPQRRSVAQRRWSARARARGSYAARHGTWWWRRIDTPHAACACITTGRAWLLCAPFSLSDDDDGTLSLWRTSGGDTRHWFRADGGPTAARALAPPRAWRCGASASSAPPLRRPSPRATRRVWRGRRHGQAKQHHLVPQGTLE